MGLITISNIVDGQIDGQTYRMGTTSKRTISHGRRYLLDVTNEWRTPFPDLNITSGLRIFVIINKGAGEMLLRHGSDPYRRIVIPAGSAYLYTAGETSGEQGGNPDIALYSTAGTTCEVAVFY